TFATLGRCRLFADTTLKKSNIDQHELAICRTGQRHTLRTPAERYADQIRASFLERSPSDISCRKRRAARVPAGAIHSYGSADWRKRKLNAVSLLHCICSARRQLF